MGLRTHYEPGAFCWTGLAAADPIAAAAFYADLFAWDARELAAGSPGGVTLLCRKGEEAAILYRQTEDARAAGAPPHWNSFVSVEDAAATVARAEALGGTAAFREPFDVPTAGRVAAIRDPSGAILSLWEPRGRVGATVVREVGALCWNELAPSDLPRARSFYRELFGWDYETGDDDYTTIWNAGRRNGSIRGHSILEESVEAAWLPYFGVESAEAAAHRAEGLGGQVLAMPTETSSGVLAVIADPERAAFGVVQMSSNGSPEHGSGVADG
jgi:uncharacterized protein